MKFNRFKIHGPSFSLLALAFALSSVQNSEAKVTMSSLWGDNMVIQRNKDVIFRGQAEGKQVTITPSWSNNTYQASVDIDGHWSIAIPTGDAGGPYHVSLSDGEELVLQNVLLGDVWLCMGQSNMQCDMRGYPNQPVKGSAHYIATAKESSPVRLYTTEVTSSPKPVASPNGEWKLTNSENVSQFSALGYMFGIGLQSVVDVPIGLVSVNMGGSSIETWMRHDWLNSVKPYEYTLKEGVGVNQGAHKHAEYLYNGMVDYLRDMSVKGGIWYQGETNSPRPDEYVQLFPAMVKGLRELLDSGEFPYYYVQIAPYDEYPVNEGVLMREAMAKLMSVTPRTGMVTTTDVGEEKIVHPRYKQEVADRLIYWALGDCYERKGFSYRAPEYAGMTIEKLANSEQACIALRFNHAPFGLTWSDKKPSQLFEIAGEDQVFYPAEAVINIYGSLQVWSEQVPAPVAVRYAFKNYVVGDYLYNTFGIPVSSFRTDDWELKK